MTAYPVTTQSSSTADHGPIARADTSRLARLWSVLQRVTRPIAGLSIAALCGHVVLAVSSVAFAGAAPDTELIAPRGGDSWAAGSYHAIAWKTAIKEPLRLEYSTDAGATWTEIVAAAPVAGRYLWRVPHRASTHCRVRLADRRGGVMAASRADFSIRPATEAPRYKWASVNDRVAFAPRDGAGALTFKDRMWLLGGWNPGDKRHFPRITNNEVWSSRDGATWDLVKPNTFLDGGFDSTRDWEGRHTGGYVVHRDKMWLVGGDANQGHYQSDVWNSADGRTWTCVNRGQDAPWGPRVLHYTVAFKDKIWVVGGQTMPGFAAAPEIFYRDVWNSGDGVHWEQVTPKQPYWSARGVICGSVVFKGRMWILGGGTYDTPATPTRQYLNDVWSSADGLNYTQHETAPWSPRQYHYVTVFDDRMWVLGGWSNGDRSDVWHSADGENWYRLNGTPWPPRHAASVFVFDNALWITAGSAMSPDVWKLERQAAATPGADSEKVAALVDIGLDGLESRRAHIFDAESPDKSPYPLDLVASDAMPAEVYARTFGLNFIDPGGKNAYAELSVDKSGDVHFEKWVDGGQGLRIVIDNETRPALITVQWTPQ